MSTTGTLKMEEGVATQFKNEMQKTYDYLVDSANTIHDCEIIKQLGFDFGTIDYYLETIESTKESVNTLLGIVMQSEDDLIKLDQNGTDRLETVFGTPNEDQTKESESQSDTETKDTDTKNDKKQTGDDGGTKTTTQNTNYHDPGDNGDNGDTNNNPELNYYEFNMDRDVALKAGDVFIDDQYSLTKFTNYLLYKYNIKDKKVAELIYQSVLKYGNEYYNTYNRNPLLEVPEKEILSIIYNDLHSIIANSNEDTFWNQLKMVKI